jgi:hypothetical protein
MSSSDFTMHAWRRISGRSISEEGIEAALVHGRRYWNQGREVYRLDRRSIIKAKKYGAELYPYEGVHVVIGDSGEIITAYRNRTGKKIPR